MEIKVKKVSDNPFYGMKNCLKLFQDAGKTSITDTFLDICWEEVMTSTNHTERKQMFFSLLFSIGDITAREHNIFKGNKIDSGGNSLRENFRIIMKWIYSNQRLQYNKFMFAHLFNEYTTFDNLIAARVKTQKKTNKIIEVIDMLGDDDNINVLANYIMSIIRGNNPFDKHVVAKFLTRPRLSKRQGNKTMLPQTKELMKKREHLIELISIGCDFPYQQRKGYVHFSGYYTWRKEYIGDMESVMFSSGKIKEFDQEGFIAWLNKIPATARLRVRNRLLNKNEIKPKWGEMGKWFLAWENFKEEKQTQQRVLEEKVRQGDESEETLHKLKNVKKEAKVTVGANNFADMFAEIVTGIVDIVKIQPFLDKFKLPYNTLTFIDDSGSMHSVGHPKYRFKAYQFGAFMATISLLKNPSDVGRSILGLFSRTARIIRHISVIKKPVNSLLESSAIHTNIPLYEPNLNFIQNMHNIAGMLKANATYQGTYISSIPESLNQWAAGDDEKIELLREFPVWTVITDGNFNSMPSPESSMNDFMYRCQRYFGFKPFIIAIDVSAYSANIEKFTGIENFMFLPPNPAQIEQFLTNFTDIDIVDVYTPLQSLFRSNRYELVRKNIL